MPLTNVNSTRNLLITAVDNHKNAIEGGDPSAIASTKTAAHTAGENFALAVSEAKANNPALADVDFFSNPTTQTQLLIDFVSTNLLNGVTRTPGEFYQDPSDNDWYYVVKDNADLENKVTLYKDLPNQDTQHHQRVAFADDVGVTQSIPINNFITSNVTKMSSIFSGTRSFNQDIGSWDVSNVTHMTSMFSGATSFNQDISSWDMSNATHMSYMFNGATSFNQDLSSWNFGNIMERLGFDDNTPAWVLPKPTFN